MKPTDTKAPNNTDTLPEGFKMTELGPPVQGRRPS